MSNKKENFRPKGFDPEDVKKYSSNKSDFYNEAIIEKLETMELVYPEILKEKQVLYKNRKEIYDSEIEIIQKLKKRLKQLERETEFEKKELDKLKNEIENYSEVVKENEENKKNQQQLIKENEDKLKEECEFIIRMVYNYEWDKDIYKVTLKHIKDTKAFETFKEFKDKYLIEFIEKNCIPNRSMIYNNASKKPDVVSAEDVERIKDFINKI